MYTKGEASPLAKAFIDYMLSPAFEKNYVPRGYGIMSKMKVSR